jgi:peptide subunit release factor 1 (eRF1)
VNRRFHLRPLALVMDSTPKLCVALLERTKARLLDYDHHQATEILDFFNELPRRGRSDGWGGYDAGHAERHVQNDAMQHYRYVADALLEMYERGRFEKLVIGCRDDQWAQINDALHVYLQENLLGRFRVDPGLATTEDVETHVERLLAETETSRRDDIIREVLGQAHMNGRGAVGLKRVLRSLETGEVQTLLIGNRFKAAGAECGNCGHIEMRSVHACSLCNHPVNEVEDLSDALISAALRNGAEIMYVDNDPELDRAGNVAALLRFRADQNTAMKLAS